MSTIEEIEQRLLDTANFIVELQTSMKKTKEMYSLTKKQIPIANMKMRAGMDALGIARTELMEARNTIQKG